MPTETESERVVNENKIFTFLDTNEYVSFLKFSNNSSYVAVAVTVVKYSIMSQFVGERSYKGRVAANVK